MGRTTVIAELGSSPAPAWDLQRWIDAAALTGADAVKVQLFKAEHFPLAEQASKRPLEFPRARLREFVVTAHAYGLTAGASVFDVEAVQYAADVCDWLKLAAREIDNYGLQVAVFNTDRHIYRSQDRFERLQSNKFHGCIPLYAIQHYPVSMAEALVKLVRWAWLYRGGRWGWSSHTRGMLDCILADRLGAAVIEKHLALSSSDLESGHSLLPDKFAAMVRSIRKGEKYVTH